MDMFTNTITLKRRQGKYHICVVHACLVYASSPRLTSKGRLFSLLSSRANIDAINVHPLEFFLGEYNHMWSMFLCCRIFNLQIHILATLLFLVIGGALAGLNHTRFDIEINFFGIHIFDSKAHDVHHRIPQSNYGQYSMFWDYVFGTYR